jgi:uncharacterized protein
MGASPGAPRTLRGMAAMGAARMQLGSMGRRGRTSLGGLARISWCILVLATLLGLVLPAVAARAAPGGLRAGEVSFVGSGGVVLHGTVLTPAATPRRRPGLVMLQGAGNRGRHELRAEAEAFARRGVVTLIYDKRTVGYSLLHRDYSVLAEDALAGLRLLRSRGDVDPASVGLWAQSEGAFVAPLAANRSTDVAFLITVGAVGVTPVRQTAWQYGQYLRHAGVSGSLAHTMQVTSAQMTVAAGLSQRPTSTRYRRGSSCASRCWHSGASWTASPCRRKAASSSARRWNTAATPTTRSVWSPGFATT